MAVRVQGTLWTSGVFRANSFVLMREPLTYVAIPNYPTYCFLWKFTFRGTFHLSFALAGGWRRMWCGDITNHSWTFCWNVVWISNVSTTQTFDVYQALSFECSERRCGVSGWSRAISVTNLLLYLQKGPSIWLSPLNKQSVFLLGIPAFFCGVALWLEISSKNVVTFGSLESILFI